MKCVVPFLTWESLAQRPKPHDKNPGGRILAAEFEKNDCVTLVRWWCRCAVSSRLWSDECPEHGGKMPTKPSQKELHIHIQFVFFN